MPALPPNPSRRHPLPGAVCLLAVIGCLATPVLRAEPPAADRLPTVDQLAAELVRKARKSLRTLEVYPQISTRFVERHKHLSNDQLIDALAQRHHSDPGVDGFIKMQFLAFKPKLQKMTDQQFDKIVRYLPPLVGPPRVPGSIQRYAAATKGLKKSDRPRVHPKILKSLSRRFNAQLAEASERNRRGLDYRVRLLSKLPRRDGMRLHAALVNYHDLHRSGAAALSTGRSAQKGHRGKGASGATISMGYIIAEAEKLTQLREPLSPKMRRKILGVLNQIKNVEGEIRHPAKTSVRHDRQLVVSMTGTRHILGKNAAHYKQIMACVDKAAK